MSQNSWKSPCGRVTLIRGEALECLQQLGEDSVDAIITDPPYCSGGSTRSSIGRSPKKKYCSNKGLPDFLGDHRDQLSMLHWVGAWMAQAFRVSRLSGRFIVFSDWRQLAAVINAVQFGGWIYRGLAVWDKTQRCRPQLGRFRNQAEYMVWGSKGTMPTKGAVHPGVFTVPSPAAKNRVHLTEKPLTLMRAITEFTSENGVTLDPFMGSGSTGVATIESGRSFIGIEMSPHYFEVAKARIQNTLAKLAKGG